MQFLEKFGHIIMIIGFLLIGIGGFSMVQQSSTGAFSLPNILVGVGVLVYVAGRIGVLLKKKHTK